MKKYLLLFLVALNVCLSASIADADWPMFRGGLEGSNARSAIVPPTRWTESENIAWKISLTGSGLSSPIVVKDRVIITSVTGVKQDRLHVLCYSANDGKELWHRQLWATGRTLTHPMSSVAANTPASDGEHIFAFFSSNDLAAFDMDGNLLWFRGLALDFPLAGNDVGMSSSPIIAGNTVIAQSEAQGESFIVGLSADTGETRYQIDRPKEANWTTPLLHEFVSKSDSTPAQKPNAELIISGDDGVTGFDSQTGKELWKIKTKCDVISSAVLLGDMLIVPTKGITAYEFKKFGEAPELAWNNPKLNPGASSPVADTDRQIYVVNRAGVLNAANGKTGSLEWQLRLKGSFWATPLYISKTMFACAKDGNVQVIDCEQPTEYTYDKESYGQSKPADQSKTDNSTKSDEDKKTEGSKEKSDLDKKSSKKPGKIIVENKLDGDIYASPAFSNGAIYIRTKTELYKIAGTKKSE